jgi:hypothetical protein
MNELIARAHVIWLTISSALTIYANHTPHTCDVSSPDTIRGEDGITGYGAFERPLIALLTICLLSHEVVCRPQAGISPRALAAVATILAASRGGGVFSLFFW